MKECCLPGSGKSDYRFFFCMYFIQGCFMLMFSDLVAKFWTNLRVDYNEYDGNLTASIRNLLLKIYFYLRLLVDLMTKQ